MAKRKFPPTAIVGAGAVGTALATALKQIGYPIVSVISRTESHAKSLAKKTGCKHYSTDIKTIDPASRLILLTVSDPAIQLVSKKLSSHKGIDFSKTLVVHTSGILNSDVLLPVKNKGASVAAVHPIQSFPRNTKRSPIQPASGIFFGVECEKPVLPKVKNLVNDLNSDIILVPKELRPLYHVACVFSSSYILTVLNAVNVLSSPLKMKHSWKKVFMPLMTTVIENALNHTPGDALTGPIVRGDLKTIKNHVEAIHNNAPEIFPLYLTLGIEVATMARNHHRISNQQFKKILYLLAESMNTNSTKSHRKALK